MREIDVGLITQAVKQLCVEINYELSEDMTSALDKAQKAEASPLGAQIFSMLKENTAAAKNESIPICQDTGMAVVFIEVGQEVHFFGGCIEDAINEGVKSGYTEGYLRKSVVSDPLERINTGDNTPAVIHFSVVPGDRVTLTVTAKGFGSENTSRLFMLKPADGEEGVKKAVITAVKEAGANACPPVVVGVGIGGNFEKCALMAKHALTRELSVKNPVPSYAAMEEELLTEINELGIGPAGLGGSITALGVNIEAYPTHIAGLPVAVNICCHVNRHKTVII